MIKQLAHACLYSNKIKASLDFYIRIMGFPLKFKMDNEKGEEFGYYVTLGNMTFLEIFDAEKACAQWGHSREGLYMDGKIRHLCIEVEDMEQTVADLKSRGAVVSELMTGSDGSIQAFLQDPDGNTLELMEYTEKSLQLK